MCFAVHKFGDHLPLWTLAGYGTFRGINGRDGHHGRVWPILIPAGAGLPRLSSAAVPPG
jgi:hypothetical protein